MNELAELLIDKNLSLCSLESFTVGHFASKIGVIPSISKVYKGSLICYQTTIKETILHISKETIIKYGVVSKEVAIEMADKGLSLFQSDIAISFTGNAGPTALEGKPVGLIYYAINVLGCISSYQLLLQGTREEIIEQAIHHAVQSAFNIIKDKS